MQRSAKYPRLLTLAACVLAVAALSLAKAVLIPFALALLASFLLAPFVLKLQRWGFGRVAAALTAVLLVFLVTCATGWLVLGQVQEVASKVSQYEQNIRERMSSLRAALAKPIEATQKVIRELGAEPAPAAGAPGTPAIQTVRIAEAPRGPFEFVSDTLGPALEGLKTAAMALLFAIVMLLRRDDLGDRFIRLVGRGQIVVTTRALEEAAKKVGSYLWRLLFLNGVHGVVIWVGLTLIGVPYALLWGVLAALLGFIPYVGMWIAASLAVVTALAVSTGWSEPVLTLGLFALLGLASSHVLEPWLYGAGTGISPLAILVSAFFWTWLWGPVGLMLSTPLTVCLVVMGKYVPQLQFLQLLFGDGPGLSPPARLYQRLVAGDQDQAWLVLEKELGEKALHEVYDSVVLPVLAMAEHDRKEGALDQAGEARIEETLQLLLQEAGGLEAAVPAEPAAIAAVAPLRPLRVLCVPARGAADALGALMLRQVLEREGVHVEVASVAELGGATLGELASRRVDLVCISAVPPSTFMHVRYLCKRLMGRFPELPIVAGMWTLEPGTEELAERLPILAGVQVVTSLGEARERACQHAERLRLALAVGSDGVLAASA